MPLDGKFTQIQNKSPWMRIIKSQSPQPDSVVDNIINHRGGWLNYAKDC